ncbi:uncharacterized protein G2W53_041096 [Senna tora]|uniref:Uncharacterized protein n=1 Tax=Senna tora TaxID=362788 RepID=A0A834SD86_9FABA|nr:uncharacterized protein G2W53_041096 [Senna tora]
MAFSPRSRAMSKQPRLSMARRFDSSSFHETIMSVAYGAIVGGLE